jgi:hypothetical protein
MQASGLVPLHVVLAYLATPLVSLAMIWYLLIWLSRSILPTLQPDIFVFIVAYSAIIAYSVIRLAYDLFPAWWGEGQPAGSRLVLEVMEIEGRV